MIATAHLTEEQFQLYKNRRIPLNDLLEIGDHLAECKECREKLDRTEERAAILEALKGELQSVLVKGSQDLTCKELALYIDAAPDSQQTTSEKPLPVLSLNRFTAIVPLVIGIAAIFILLGLIAFFLTNFL